jgi:hypothetical protein
MGIGYRNFVKTLQAELTDPGQERSVTVEGDFYLNRRFGVGFKKPQNWSFIFVKDFGEFKRKIGADRKQVSDPDWNGLSEPAVILAKYKADGKEPFSPAIIIYFLHKNSTKEMYEDEQENTSFRHIVKLIADGSKKLFKDHHFIKKHYPRRICGCKAVESLWSWNFEDIKTKQRWICESWSLLIELNNYIFSISMIDSKQAGEIEQTSFVAFVDSIRLL